MPKTQKKFQLKTPSQPDNLAIIRDFVTKIAAKVGFTNDEASKIELAVDEACTNVIKHAYGYNSDQIIDIQIKVDNKKLMIIVSDKGKGFNPEQVKVPDVGQSIKEGRGGGLGICLMKTLMDKVDFQIKPGSVNQVKMTKYLT